MAEINWKSKYEALKSKFMESVDMAFRLGYEQGAQESQMQQVQQQQQQDAEMMAAQQGQGQEEGQEEQAPEQMQESEPDSAHPGGSELDQHIAQLESMLGKGEIDMASLIKSVGNLKKLQKNIELNNGLKKSAQAIPEIAKNLHKPKFKLSQNATHNMSKSAKEAVNTQQKIVDNIMKSWAEQEAKTGKDILQVLQTEGITLKKGE